MDLNNLDWRIAVMAAVAILALYLAYALLRLGRIEKDKQTSAAEATPVPAATVPVAQESEPPRVNEAVEFATRQFMRGVEAELEQVRGELAALREDVARLKAARQTAPQYAEAMAMASDGADVHTLAERCGISVAEAELVRALSRGEEHTKDLP